LEHTTQCADLVVTCRYIFAYYICVFKKKHFFYLSVTVYKAFYPPRWIQGCSVASEWPHIWKNEYRRCLLQKCDRIVGLSSLGIVFACASGNAIYERHSNSTACIENKYINWMFFFKRGKCWKCSLLKFGKVLSEDWQHLSSVIHDRFIFSRWTF